MDSFFTSFFLLLRPGGILEAHPVELCKVIGQSYRTAFSFPVSDIDSLGSDGGIQAQTSGTVQVIVDESADRIHTILPELRNGTGFKSVASQWTQECPDEWYLLKSYDFAAPCPTSDPWDLKNASRSIRQNFLERFRDPDRKWARVMRRITTRKEKDGSLQGASLSETKYH